MTKTIKALLIAGSLGAMCAGLAACSNDTKLDEHFKNGNIISVTYDGSGGNILGKSNVSIVDMFNPDKYTPDSEGYVHIKLRNPSDPARPNPGVDHINVERYGYSLVGWYKTREVVKDGDDVYDDKGNKLVERDGSYYKVTVNADGKEIEEEAVPQYSFADPWDFATDTVDFKIGDEKLDMTLYAAWVPLFSFDYYYKVKNEWTKFGTTTFDYFTAQTIDDSDKAKVTDSVFIPEWSLETGRMEHKFSTAYTFPGLEKMTFKAAYSDENCQNAITRANPYKHAGSIDYATASAINPVQKVYVEFDEGSRYRISTAEQFSAIGDPDGYYTILSDELDFNCKLDEESGELTFTKESFRWPIPLTTSTFTGKIEGEGGKAVTFKNVGAQLGTRSNSVDTQLGGLFGEIGEKAVIKNVTFENAIFDIQNVRSTKGASFGMLSGNIDKEATVENVKIGGEMRLWNMSISGALNFNVLTNGNKAGVTKTKIVVKVCGEKRLGVAETEVNKYLYYIDHAATTVDEDEKITIVTVKGNDKRYQEKQYYIVYGGDD